MELESKDGSRQLNLTALEKSVIGFFSLVAFAMLAWLVNTTNETSKKLVAVETAIAFVKADAEKAGEDRFTGSQGRDLARRVDALEQYHRDLRGSQ